MTDADRLLAEGVWWEAFDASGSLDAYDVTEDTKPWEIIAAYGERRYREGVEAMRDAAFDAWPSYEGISYAASRLLAESKE